MAGEEQLAKDLQKVENKAIDELNDRFRASVRKTISETDWDEIERRLMAQSQAEQIDEAISWQGYNPSDLIEETFWSASEISAANIADVVAKGSSLSFKLTDPNALKWLQEYGAEEIQYISDSQKSAIKQIVTNGYRDGVTYQQQAREIKQLIGLDPRRAEAVQNMRAKLLERGRLSDDKIDRQAARYAEKLLKQRARNIAVQEATTAGAQAFFETTKDACKRGILDTRKYEGYRIVTGDERLCPKCADLAGEARPLPEGVYHSSGSVTPKLHHLCRCVEGIRKISMNKQSAIPKKAVQGFSDIVFDTQALKRKDGIIYCQTVPIIEGVYEQWGIRVYRSYAEFSKYCHWLAGIPVVSNHEEITPDARRIGQLFDPVNRPDGLKISATTRFYEIDLTPRESEQILGGKPIEGSLRWMCYIVEQAGEWTDPATGEKVPYDFVEVGPYVFLEYSMVRAGVIGTKDGAGFNMQCKNCQKNSIHNAPGGADMEKEELKLIIDEAIAPLKEQITTLEQKGVALDGKLQGIEGQAEAKQEAEQKERFMSKLKPAFLDQADTHWAECKQIGYLTFEAKHPEMIIRSVQERQLHGSAVTPGGQEFNLAAEQAKIDYRRRA